MCKVLLNGWPRNALGAGALADVDGMSEVPAAASSRPSAVRRCRGPLEACGLVAWVGTDAGPCDELLERCESELGFAAGQLGVSEHGE